MQVWFYKAEVDGDWKDKLIAFWTGGPYSHVELCFSDGMCFTSSPRDGGVRFKEIERKDENWEVIDLRPYLVDMIKKVYGHKFDKLFCDWDEIADLYESKVRDWCESQVGKKYDWKAVIGHAFAERDFEERGRWYCSEIVLHALKRFGLYGGITRLHPVEMHKELASQLQQLESIA